MIDTNHRIIGIKRNLLSPYSKEDEPVVLNIVEGLFNETQSIQDIKYGHKNLIYFTVFGKWYIKLLNICLTSIYKHCNNNQNFDILIICDKDTADQISKLSIAKRFSIFYFIIDKPLDGIEASKNKCSIFKYSNINEYNKILFLDTDIICIKDINIIFDKEINNNILYTVYNKAVDISAHNGVHHGLTKISNEQLQKLKEFNQRPFNAGQFLMKNSLKIKKHFENILWFMNNWPGEYFFEQCFMVQYFARNILCNNSILENDIVILIIPKNQDLSQFHNNDTILIHFAGPPLDAIKKIDYIKQYKNLYQL